MYDGVNSTKYLFERKLFMELFCVYLKLVIHTNSVYIKWKRNPAFLLQNLQLEYCKLILLVYIKRKTVETSKNTSITRVLGNHR